MSRKEIGKQYVFDSAWQVVYDAWGRPRIIEGKHILEKVTDTFMDRICRRSWYVLDGDLLVDIGRGSYIESRLLKEVDEWNQESQEEK